MTIELKRISSWVNGAAHPSSSGRSGKVFNPATGEHAANVDFLSVEEIDTVVAASKAAFTAWRGTGLSRRAEIMFRFRELLEANKGKLAEIISLEHGKVPSDAAGEIARGLENVEFACGIPHLLKGGYSILLKLSPVK